MRGGVVVVVFVKVEERSADKIPNLFSHPVLCPSCLIFFGFFHFSPNQIKKLNLN